VTGKERQDFGFRLLKSIFGASETKMDAPQLWSDGYPLWSDACPMKPGKHPTKVAGHPTTPDNHPTKVEKYPTTSEAHQIWLDAHQLWSDNPHRHNGRRIIKESRLFSAWPDPVMARQQNRAIWRYRLKGMVVGWAVGGSLSALTAGGQYYSYYSAVQTDKPRRSTFERECAHPVEGDPAKFNHASAGQGSCEVYTGTARFKIYHPYHSDFYQKYWLNIGNQVVKDEVGLTNRGNPEALDWSTAIRDWLPGKPVAVKAVFWKGQLMTIYSSKNGFSERIQTVSNPTSSAMEFKAEMPTHPGDYFDFLLPELMFTCVAGLVGMGLGEGRYQKSDIYIKARKVCADKFGL